MVDFLGLREWRVELHRYCAGLPHLEMVAVADQFVAIEPEELVQVRRCNFGVEVFADPLPSIEDDIDELA